MKIKFLRLLAVTTAVNISIIGGSLSYTQVYATDQAIDISANDVEDLSSVLRRKYYVVFAVPCCVC